MVNLRGMTEADLDMVLAWRNQEGVRKNMYTSHVITRDEHVAWWKKQSISQQTILLVAESDDVPVGVVAFTNYTGIDGVATWAFYAGDVAPRGVGSKMEFAALNYAFEVLRLRKLECEVLSFNMPVVNLHLRHGFEIEGIFRQAHMKEGKYFDIYRLAIFSKNWLSYLKPDFSASENGRFGFLGKGYSSTAILQEESVQAFIRASGDKNPVHTDEAYAKSLGFGGRIVHGMLAGSLFSEVFANHFPGPGTVYLAQTLEFIKPIAIGATVTSSVKVISQIGRRLTVECQLHCGDDVCVTGQAKLLLPKS